MLLKRVKRTKKNMHRYLQEVFTSPVSSYELRDFENKLLVAELRTDYLKRSFAYPGAVLWNSLPPKLRLARSLVIFN